MKLIFCIGLCWLMLTMPVIGASAPYGGHFVLYTSSDPKTFNDIIAKEASSSVVTSIIFEGLTTTDPVSLKPIPNLAKSWDVSADGLTWVFHLRQDVKWSDGRQFTADDVVFTFNELIFNKDIPSSARDVFTIEGKVFKVVKLDTFTVQFVLPVKFAPFLRSLGQSILPKHCLVEAVNNKKFVHTWGIDSTPQAIVGTGPFRLSEYKPGERLVFERNPYYWKKSNNGDQLPYLDKIVMLIIPSPEGALLRFIDGDIDYLAVKGTDYPLLKPLEVKKNFNIFEAGADFGSSFLVFNQNTGINQKTGKPFVDPIKSSWLCDVNFRRALAHAIDKNKMISILLNGFGTSQWTEMSPSAGYFYNPNVKQYDYNLAKARDLLTQAGYQDRNGDGIIEDQQGHNIEFNLMTNANGVERVQTAAIIAADLRQLGIKVNLVTPEFNVLVGKLTSTFDWDVILLGLTGGIEPHFGKNVWHSSGGLHMWYPHQEKPATTWEARIDTIFDQGVQELDDTKRKVLYDEFQSIIADQLPVIYTVLGTKMFALRHRFGNIKPSGYLGVLYNLEEIYVK